MMWEGNQKKHMHWGRRMAAVDSHTASSPLLYNCLWKSKHSTCFCRWSKNPRVKPAVFVSRSLYPPGMWCATKSFTSSLSSLSQELADTDWQPVHFLLLVCFYISYISLSSLGVCGFNIFFFTLCFSDVPCSNSQVYGCSLRHIQKSRYCLVYSLEYFEGISALW